MHVPDVRLGYRHFLQLVHFLAARSHSHPEHHRRRGRVGLLLWLWRQRTRWPVQDDGATHQSRPVGRAEWHDFRAAAAADRADVRGTVRGCPLAAPTYICSDSARTSSVAFDRRRISDHTATTSTSDSALSMLPPASPPRPARFLAGMRECSGAPQTPRPCHQQSRVCAHRDPRPPPTPRPPPPPRPPPRVHCHSRCRRHPSPHTTSQHHMHTAPHSRPTPYPQ